MQRRAIRSAEKQKSREKGTKASPTKTRARFKDSNSSDGSVVVETPPSTASSSRLVVDADLMTGIEAVLNNPNRSTHSLHEAEIGIRSALYQNAVDLKKMTELADLRRKTLEGFLGKTREELERLGEIPEDEEDELADDTPGVEEEEVPIETISGTKRTRRSTKS